MHPFWSNWVCLVSECVYVLKDILSPGVLWMCLHLTQDSRKGNGAWLYFDAEEFYFSFVRSLHPPLKAKQSPAGRLHKYCDWQLLDAAVLSPFLQLPSDLGRHSNASWLSCWCSEGDLAIPALNLVI